MAESAITTRRDRRRKALRDLDARASGLDTSTRIGNAEAFAIIVRSMGYIRFFFWRYLAKFLLKLFAYAIALGFLPWPAKMLTDHVILGRPIEDAQGYPPYWRPVIDFVQGWSPFEILIFLAVLGVSLVVLIGRYITGYDDGVEAALAEGHDYATRVENQIHGGGAVFGGVWGYVEFKVNSRMTQTLNHLLRAQLFSRIGALSMTQLEEQRIGDSIYRVMYDAPQVQEIFYETTHTPIMSTLLYVQAGITLLTTYPTMPEVFWLSMSLFAGVVIGTSLFSSAVRRRGQAARAAGSLTTGTIEEGMDNVLAVQGLGANATER
ncbi:MAG: hypothetical protein OXS50_09120, partial [Gammaproteobacteria bacterium]|nr:hypothetical protein [Gammaproteobacteria bacterium]